MHEHSTAGKKFENLKTDRFSVAEAKLAEFLQEKRFKAEPDFPTEDENLIWRRCILIFNDFSAFCVKQ